MTAVRLRTVAYLLFIAALVVFSFVGELAHIFVERFSIFVAIAAAVHDFELI